MYYIIFQGGWQERKSSGMAQQLLLHNLGIASGLMVGFTMGNRVIGVTRLGLILNTCGITAALKSLLLFPLTGLAFSLPSRAPPTAIISGNDNLKNDTPSRQLPGCG